jgi:hypothetical protein
MGKPLTFPAFVSSIAMPNFQGWFGKSLFGLAFSDSHGIERGELTLRLIMCLAQVSTQLPKFALQLAYPCFAKFGKPWALAKI